MPIPVTRVDANNQLIPFSGSDIAAFGLDSQGIEDGSGGSRLLRTGGTTRNLQWLLTNPETFWDAMVYLLGANTLWTDPGDGGKQKLSRIMPYGPSVEPQLAVSEVKTLGHKFTADDLTGSLPIPLHTDIKLDCTLEIFPFELAGDDGLIDGLESSRYVEVLEEDPTAQYLTMPGVRMGLKFRKSGGGGADGQLVNYSLGFPVVKSRVRRKWYQIPKAAILPGTPDPPLRARLIGDGSATGAGRSYIGCCNATAFLGYPAQTLILLGYSAQPVYGKAESMYLMNITYTFDFVPTGANNLYYFDPVEPGTNSGWYQASRGAYSATPTDAEVQFPLREFADLFDVG